MTDHYTKLEELNQERDKKYDEIIDTAERIKYEYTGMNRTLEEQDGKIDKINTKLDKFEGRAKKQNNKL